MVAGGRVLLEDGEHRGTIRGGGNRMGVLAEETRQQRQKIFVVVDQQQMGHRGHSLQEQHGPIAGLCPGPGLCFRSDTFAEQNRWRRRCVPSGQRVDVGTHQ